MAGENWTFWLNMTNLALGVITALALLVVASAVGWELLARRRQARETDTFDEELRALWRTDSHTFSVPELGLTMADGGERIEPGKTESSKQSRRK